MGAMTLMRSMTLLKQSESDFRWLFRLPLDIQSERFSVFAWMIPCLMFAILLLTEAQLEEKVSAKGRGKSRRGHKNDDEEYVTDAVSSTSHGEFLRIPVIP